MMNISKHNPDFKLIDKLVYDNGKYVDLVYGISNTGENEGLEAYYMKTSDRAKGHYRSYRWETEKIPAKYMDQFNELKTHIDLVPEGHKLRLK